MTSFQDNPCKQVPKCQTTLGFTPARDGEDGSCDNWNSKTCKLYAFNISQVASPNFPLYSLDALSAGQPTAQKYFVYICKDKINKNQLEEVRASL